MKRSELEKFLGRNVEVTLFDMGVIRGVLKKTGTEEVKNHPFLYGRTNFYFIETRNVWRVFRCSHVTKARLL